MEWYRRSKLALNAFRSITSNITPKNSIRGCVLRTHQQCASSTPTFGKIRDSGSAIKSLIFRNSGLLMGLKQNRYGLFLGGARGYYYVDNRQVYHFRPRGYKRLFQTPRAVATVILVAHAVARHAAEGITENLWFTIVQLILYQFVMPDLVYTMSILFLSLPLSRRMEMEADYIGLLLMAHAGYDPQVAPRVYEKLGKVTGDSALREYLSAHPSGKRGSFREKGSSVISSGKSYARSPSYLQGSTSRTKTD